MFVVGQIPPVFVFCFSDQVDAPAWFTYAPLSLWCCTVHLVHSVCTWFISVHLVHQCAPGSSVACTRFISVHLVHQNVQLVPAVCCAPDGQESGPSSLCMACSVPIACSVNVIQPGTQHSQHFAYRMQHVLHTEHSGNRCDKGQAPDESNPTAPHALILSNCMCIHDARPLTPDPGFHPVWRMLQGYSHHTHIRMVASVTARRLQTTATFIVMQQWRQQQ